LERRAEKYVEMKNPKKLRVLKNAFCYSLINENEKTKPSTDISKTNK
jgi:hypothetical protein